MRVAILQSNYLPWRGYFDLIDACDRVVVYDTAQFTKNDWRNRNRIKTRTGLAWITVPVATSGRLGQRIDEAQIEDSRWPRKHLDAIRQNYARSRYVDWTIERIEPALTSGVRRLSQLNLLLMEQIIETLGRRVEFLSSADLPHQGDASQKVLELCLAAGATRYVSGPAAKAYLDIERLERAGVRVEWFDYSGYEPYPQLWGAFEPAVSIIDLLCNCGEDAPRYMKSART